MTAFDGVARSPPRRRPGFREREDLVRNLADIVAELLLGSGHGGVGVVEGGQAVQEDAVGFSVAFSTSPVTLKGVSSLTRRILVLSPMEAQMSV